MSAKAITNTLSKNWHTKKSDPTRWKNGGHGNNGDHPKTKLKCFEQFKFFYCDVRKQSPCNQFSQLLNFIDPCDPCCAMIHQNACGGFALKSLLLAKWMILALWQVLSSPIYILIIWNEFLQFHSCFESLHCSLPIIKNVAPWMLNPKYSLHGNFTCPFPAISIYS